MQGTSSDGSPVNALWAHADEGRMRTDDVIAEIEQLLTNAKPVPLTDQIRLNPGELRKLLEELKTALAEERRR